MSVDTFRSWVVVGACFFINVIISGTIRMSGIFFVESVPRYKVGRSAASFPYTFVNFVTYLSGPLFGYFAQKFGIHKILVIGSLLSTFGLGACFFVNNINYVSLFYGVILGLGVGSSLLIPVLINQHFYKYRAIASGLRTSGKSFGSFLLPPVTEFFLGKYGLSGTFLVLSGILFNYLPAALLLRVMKFRSKTELGNCYLWYANSEKKPLLQVEKPIKIYSENTLKQHNMNEGKQLNSDLNTHHIKENFNESNITENLNKNKKNLENSRSTNNKDAIYNKEKLDFRENETDKNITRSVSISNEVNFSPTKRPLEAQKSISFSVVLDPVFICLAISRSLYMFILTCLTTVIVDFASDIGVPEQEQGYTIMVYSIGELVGPLSLGWLVDKSYFSKTTFMAISCYLQSLIAVSIAFSTGSAMLFSLLAAMGYVHSVETFVTPLLVADYIPERKQTVAMTSISVLAAPFSLLVSPLIGFLRDEIGSYEYMFYGLGVLSAISGSLIVTIRCCLKRKVLEH